MRGAGAANTERKADAPLLLWISPLLAVVVTPSLVWVVAEQPMAVRFELAYGLAAGVGLAAAALLSVLSRGFKHRIRWALSVTAMATLVFFQWPTLTSVGNSVASSISAGWLADVVPVAFAAGLLWLATRNGQEWQFAAIMNTATVLVVATLTAMALPYVELAQTSAPGPIDPTSPDVVVLILDGYARSDTLEEVFGYDNSSFVHDLEARGFEVTAAAQANYSYTFASLASMLELDYVFDLGTIADSELSRVRAALSGNPTMLDIFRKAGYEIAYTENSWEGSHCGAAVDVCIRDGFTEQVLWKLGQLTILAPMMESTRPHPFNTISLEHLELLPAYVSDNRRGHGPRLTISHVILPHPPFLLDAQCDRFNDAIRRGFRTSTEDLIDERRDLYADQLTCTNRKVLEAVDAIIADRPDAIVMITGDHGSASGRLEGFSRDIWTRAAIDERVRIFSAYRLPKCGNEVYSSMTPVNGARLITDCATNSDLGLLEDVTLWAPTDGEGEVVTLDAKLAASLP